MWASRCSSIIKFSNRGNGIGRRSVSEWCKRNIVEVSQALDKRQVSAVELTQACMDQIEATSRLNMFVTKEFENAMKLAKESDKRRQEGKTLGPLDGIPVGIKDIFCTKNSPTTAASTMLEGFVAPYESTPTSRLLENGAIPLGKLNMDEFAMGSATIYSKYGATINPWSPDLDSNAFVAGGSSGGSAAAVASGCCFAALGSDTGGSVRQPAAYCGIVGVKPTYGRISRHGMIAYASSLDTPGVFARSVEDSALVLRAIAGPDQMDSTCLQEALPNYWLKQAINEKTTSLKGLMVGIPHEYLVEELPEEITQVWNQGIQWLRDAGARVVHVSLPSTKLCIPAYYILACAEASSNLSRYDGVRYGYRAKNVGTSNVVGSGDQSDALHDLYCRTRSEGFGSEVKRRILSGTFVLSAGAMSDYYERAVVIRERIRQDFDACFESGVDVLMTPTTPSGPFRVQEQSEDDPVAMYLNDVMTIPANMAGVPSISVPTALTTNTLPLGIQLMGARKHEEDMFQVAKALQKYARFDRLVPEQVYQPRA